MGWRVVKIGKISKLELKRDKLIVRYIDEQKQVFINEIDTLIIENTAISLTTNLLVELLKNKVNIIFCDEKRNPCGTLNAIYGSHNTSSKVKNQVMWSKETKDLAWSLIVKEKIFQQMIFLKELGKQEHLMLESYIDEIENGDITNREAFAAKVYFNSLFGNSFSRNQDTSINAALNYGYSIILSYINREIISSGYVTQIGIHHDNQYNYYNLGCDFMEPFRIMIDREVYLLNCEKFGTEEKNALINVLNKEVVIDDKKQYLSNAITIYVKSLLQNLEEGKAKNIKRYRMKE